MDIERLCMGCMKELKEPGVCPHCGYRMPADKVQGHYLKPYSILNGKYLVGRVLGEGGFGITYIGYDLNLEMPVAIKEFYPNGFVARESGVTSMVSVYQGANLEAVGKWKHNFIKEARTLAKCAHLSGIVGVKDFFEENGTAYIVMEYLEGMTLKEYVKSRGGKVEIYSLLKCLEPVMASLAKVHENGLIHRDISPDNIMFMEGGSMKLLDFGAARDYAAEDEKSLSVMLKPGYAPEEQYRTKGKQGPWSDVYAFSATIYKCITGVTPPESMERMRQDDLKTPGSLGIPISPQVEAAILKGMAVYAENRYQSMTELMTALFAGNREISAAVPLSQSQIPAVTVQGQTMAQTGFGQPSSQGQTVYQSLPPIAPPTFTSHGETAPLPALRNGGKTEVVTKIREIIKEQWKIIVMAAGVFVLIVVCSVFMNKGRSSESSGSQTPSNEMEGNGTGEKEAAVEAAVEEEVISEEAETVIDPEKMVEDTILRGREHLEAGEYDAAFACLEEARELAPDKEEIYSLESDVYLAQNDIENAVEILDTGIEQTGKMTLDTRKDYIIQHTEILKQEIYWDDTVLEEAFYDEEGNVIDREYYTESGYYDGRVIFEYDNGKPVREAAYYENEQNKYIIYYDGGVEYSGFYYDIDGRQTEAYACEYDSAGRVSRKIYYDANNTISWFKDYTYDQRGNQIQDVSYNADGSMSSWQEYTYDADGNPLGYKAYHANGTMNGYGEYRYDEFGRQISQADYDGYRNLNWRVEYEYNGFDNISVSRHYDKNNSEASFEKEYVYTYEFQGN